VIYGHRVTKDRRPVRLMSDYGAGWPLWGDRGQLAPSDYEISDELATRLYAWQDHFEQHFDHEQGWRSADDAAAYAAEGTTLQRLLTAEIGRWADVELSLWPVPAADDAGAPRPVRRGRR
jgi:hypothetical protein